MVYRRPCYFLGQQDAGLPLKRRSQSVIDSRRYSGAALRYFETRSPSPYDRHEVRQNVYTRRRIRTNYNTSPSRTGGAKPMWIDTKTGRVVEGPAVWKGERLIRFEDSTTPTTSSNSTEQDYRSQQKSRIALTDYSQRQSLRRHFQSPVRNRPSSPIRRSASRHTSATRGTYYRYSSRGRNQSPRRVAPPSSSSSYSTSSTSQLRSDSSSELSSSSSGYSSSVGDWRRRYGGQRQVPNLERTGKIITLNPRGGKSPLRNLVPHRQRQSTRLRKKTGSDDSLLYDASSCHCRHAVSRRTRATSGKSPDTIKSNLSFFEETILPSPKTPLNSYIPLHYDDCDSYSDTESSYLEHSRNLMRNTNFGAMRSFHSSPYPSSYGPHRCNC